MSPKSDFLGECNTFGVSLPDFTAQFCNRCYTRDCSRSQGGKSRFDQRVSNWEERLFTNPSKMEEKDPRYLPMANKPFKMIAGPVPNISSSWVDPRDIPSEEVVLKPAAEPFPLPVPIRNAVSTEKEESASVSAPPPSPPVRGTPKNLLINTPNQAGRMLSTQPPVTKPAPKDPWAIAAPKEESTEIVVKPGTKIKVGV